MRRILLVTSLAFLLVVSVNVSDQGADSGQIGIEDVSTSMLKRVGKSASGLVIVSSYLPSLGDSHC
jgi:hypothetical protein